jgi:glycosyltransferase involved in cell wall biosynthesis
LLVANSPEELVQTALEVIRRPEEMADRAENGRRQVLARYSWELLAERLNGVWNAIRESSLIAA